MLNRLNYERLKFQQKGIPGKPGLVVFFNDNPDLAIFSGICGVLAGQQNGYNSASATNPSSGEAR